MEELKRLLEEAMRNWEEFKKRHTKDMEEMKAGKHVPSDIKETTDRLNKSIDTLQKQMEDMKTAMNRTDIPTEEDKLDDYQKSAMVQYLRKGDKNLTADQIKALDELKALSAGTDDEGGYFVRPFWSDQINKQIFESSPVRQHATVIQISTSEYKEVADYDEPAANWVGEKSTRSVTDSNDVKQLSIPTHELSAQPKATQTILEDAFIDMEAWHMGKVTGKFSRSEATAFCTGNGVTRPKGIASYTNGTGFDQVEQISSASLGAFKADGLMRVQNALFEEYQPNARWFMQRLSAGAIRELKDGAGRYLWTMDKGLTNEMLNFLLGKPVHFAADVAVIASNSLSAYYGDFAQGYLIADRIGISVLRDPFSDYPFVSFKTRKRVGGGVWHFQAMKIQKLSAS